MEVSNLGRVLAQTSYNSAKKVSSYETARGILKDGFESINQNNQVTEDEKALAKLGIAVGGHTMTQQDASNARYTVMNTISSSPGGQIGNVIATTSYNAAKSVESYESARAILKDGFEAINNNYKTTDDQKTLSNLGITVGGHTMTQEDAAKARYVVMNAVNSQIGGPIGSVIATTSYNAAKSVESYESSRAILKDGFEAINNNYKTTDDQKTLANLGIAVGSHTMTPEDATKSRYVVMNAINSQIGGPIGSVIARVSYDSAKHVESYESARAILRDGFEAILNNPKATLEQKTIAQQGINVAADNMTNENAAKVRYTIMQSLF